MAGQTGLIMQGDDEANELTVEVIHEENGGLSVYNVIQAGGGGDVLSGRASTDWDVIHEYGAQLFGEDGDDVIFDSDVDDTLSGGSGDDTIHYSDGRDKIDGGDGFDTLIYDMSYPTLGQVKLTGVEKLLVAGGEVYVGSFDLNTVDFIGPDDKMYGRTLIFSKKADLTSVTFLGTHDWSLSCAKFDDVMNLSTSSVNLDITGGLGNDTITAGSGNDELSGEFGNDSLAGGDGNDLLLGQDGNDTLLGGNGNDRIYTSAGDDVVNGGNGNDMISGKVGTFGGFPMREEDFKILDGGAGNDVFKDLVIYDETASHFLGGAGTDEITLGSDISNLILKDIEILRVAGWARSITADADVLDNFEQIIGIQRQRFQIIFSSGGHFSWDGASQEPHIGTITGSNQADFIDMSASDSVWTILAGSGNDTLKAGAGYCGLSGQGGRDTFIFDDNTGRTEIMNYDIAGNDRDVIDLSAVSAITDFKDMIDHHVKTTGGGDWLTIQFGKGDIELYQVEVEDLSEKAFIF
jgi:Ca2+-binding RTX toxin-like protein